MFAIFQLMNNMIYLFIIQNNLTYLHHKPIGKPKVCMQHSSVVNVHVCHGYEIFIKAKLPHAGQLQTYNFYSLIVCPAW